MSVALVLATLFCSADAPPALAHAVLLGAEPSENAIVESAPQQVRLFFSEPVDPELFALEVYDASQHRVDRGDARVASEDRATLQTSLQDLPDGTYAVVWRVLSPPSSDARRSGGWSRASRSSAERASWCLR
jgi:methionine-rich copper-binding protein CopC